MRDTTTLNSVLTTAPRVRPYCHHFVKESSGIVTCSSHRSQGRVGIWTVYYLCLRHSVGPADLPASGGGNLSLQIRVISRSYVNSSLVTGHRCFRRRDHKGTEPKDHHRDPAEWTGLHLDPVLRWDQHHDQQVHHWQRSWNSDHGRQEVQGERPLAALSCLPRLKTSFSISDMASLLLRLRLLSIA